MSKDLLKDRYGRFYEIPAALQKSGHDVLLACIAYRDCQEPGEEIQHPFQCWHSKLGRNPFYGIVRYYFHLCKLVEEYKPQIIVGASDSLHIILAAKLAGKYKLPYIVDLYDNFESYKATHFPGVKTAFSAAVKKADGVASISQPLRNFVLANYHAQGQVELIENAIAEELFRPGDKQSAREKLGLPAQGWLMGTAGALYAERGIEVVFRAFDELQEEREDVYLVVAGPLNGTIDIPQRKNIIYLGELAHKDVPILFNALDLGLVCNVKSPFGLYCFPQKVYEMLACELPVIAADVGTMSELFAGSPACLYLPGDSHSLLKAIRQQILKPTLKEIEVPTWTTQANRFAELLGQVVRG